MTSARNLAFRVPAQMPEISSIWLIATLSLFAGCVIQTALGFGMAVIAAPIIVVFAPDWIPVPITLTALFLSVLNSYQQRHDIEWRKLATPFVTRIPGTVVGAWLLLQMDTFALQVAVALCVLFAVAVSWYGKQFAYTPGRLGIAAFVSGVMGTTTSVGGPPMALVMQHGDPKVIRANLSIYFTYSCTISLISYALIGRLDMETLTISASFIPAAILGFFVGTRARPFVDAGRFRPLLLALCASAGTLALLAAISHA